MQDLNLPYHEVKMGVAELKADLSPKEKALLKEVLANLGFEILEAREEKLVSRIENLLIKRLSAIPDQGHENISGYLSSELHTSYAHLSRLFSQVKGISLEKHFNNLRAEKAKELLYYGELDNATVAYQLGYSSPAHFSSSFKKSTGLTPTQFRQLKTNTSGLAS